MGEMGSFFASMFNFSKGILSHDAMVTVVGFLPLLLAAGVASTPLARKIYDGKIKKLKCCWLLETVFAVIILLICTSALVSNSYNPFLYFRF